MLTLFLSLLCMAGIWVGLHYGVGWHQGWSITLAILSGLGLQIGATLFIRRKITALMNAIQARITERTTALRRKYEQLGSRGAAMKFLMDQARKDQDVLMAEALESTKKMEPFCKWSFLLDRQVNAIRIQFLYQMKNFEEVDRLLPKTIFGDPVMVCMKMCRQYKLGKEEELRKTYNKYRKKFKQDSALIYATYAWMLIRKKELDKALAVLVDGKSATEDANLEANWDHVANGRVGQFSNAGFGESWYALLLEEPKQPKSSGPRYAHPGSKMRRRF